LGYSSGLGFSSRGRATSIEAGGQHDIGRVEGTFALDNGTFRVALRFARVTFNDAHTFDDHPSLFGEDGQNLPAATAFGSRNDDNFVAFLNVESGTHGSQTTSGAREMIFMKRLSRNSRATGPKMRVPRGLFSLSMITTALESKRR